ncbi:MAG: 7-carboxy-7-deazaguanine synthase QueE [Arenimonas sp.]|nr:7-carboxy-7-deazaguanine synthase QueE [Arenimonas sp.]
MPQADRLKLTEIFLSLQGEARSVGLATVFVRLTGCPLRCQYCDTAYAFHGGQWFEIDDIVKTVLDYGVSHVCVTGGEPLAQKRCILLLDKLVAAGLNVSLETSGSIDIAPVDTRVSRIVDIKTPDSAECEQNLWSNLQQLTPHDQLKFVICSLADYQWAKQQLQERQLNEVCEVLFSPSYTEIQPRDLAQWIIDDRLPVRFQMQLHKQLWGEEQGR